MMYATQYPNNSRTVIGTPILFNDDVVLYCDTTLGPVTINLLQIASGSWNTTWKLYVIDKSNNAGVNNITINAGIGQKINNASSLVLNVNSASALVRVDSNTSFIASLNYGGSGGNLEVLNQGASITLAATSMNFLGIQATAIGSAVTIQNNFIVLNYASLLTLISTNSLIPSQQYMITDAIFTVTVLETVPIIVTAITVNEISLSGSGIFLNADYQIIGNYSSVTGFVSQLGIWNNALVPVIGNCCIWNNRNYVNTSGFNFGNPDLSPADWSLLIKSSTTGYITEIDNINYKVETNEIISREDVRNNKVENFNGSFFRNIYESFFVFQWGSNSTVNNTVISQSVMESYNWTGIQNNNTLINGSCFISGKNYGNRNTLKGNNLNNGKVQFENDGLLNDNFFINNSCNVNVYNDISASEFINNIIQSPGLFTCRGTSFFKNNIIKNNDTAIIFIINSNGTFNNNNISFCTTFNIISNRNEIIGNIISNAFSFVIDINEGKINENNFQNPKLTITRNRPGAEINNNYLEETSFRVTDNYGFINSNSGMIPVFGIDLNLVTGDISGNILNGGAIDTDSNSSSIISNFITGVLRPIINTALIKNNYLYDSLLRIENNSGAIENNTFNKNSTNININTALNFSNNFWKDSNINILGTLSDEIINTWVENGIISVTNINLKINGGIYQRNVGTIAYTIDMDDPTIYDLPSQTLTIPVGLQNFIGEWYLINQAGKIIDKIINLNSTSNYATKFVPKDAAGTVQFKTITIGAAVINSIISNLGTTTYNLVGRLNGEDSIYIRRLGDYNAVEQVYQYI